MNRWTTEQINTWYSSQPWLVGCNFTPSTAINQLEMWQADTFDPVTIDRETGWAADIGMNTLRVFLHDLVWEADSEAFKKRIDTFLAICASREIRPFFVFFDDCWCDLPKVGSQPDPIPGVHNSGWLRSPGTVGVSNFAEWSRLEQYIKGILGSFGSDDRILMWDLYNEPGNSDYRERSLPLLCKAFEWAREANPSQPLTAGLHSDMAYFNTFQVEASDIITFHNYSDGKSLQAQIQALKQYNRPLICTEWLKRPESMVADCLPVFKEEKVGCVNWGLVSGKTQTIFPWGSKPGSPDPTIWFHDLFGKDGRPFDPQEISIFKALT